MFLTDGFIQATMTDGALNALNAHGQVLLNPPLHWVGFHVQIVERKLHG